MLVIIYSNILNFFKLYKNVTRDKINKFLISSFAIQFEYLNMSIHILRHTKNSNSSALKFVFVLSYFYGVCYHL